MRNVKIIDQHGSRWQCDEAVMSSPGPSLRTSCPALSTQLVVTGLPTNNIRRSNAEVMPGQCRSDWRELCAAKGQGELDWRRPAICVNWLHTITVLPTKYLSNTRILHRVNTFISLFTFEWRKYDSSYADDNKQLKKIHHGRWRVEDYIGCQFCRGEAQSSECLLYK